MRIGGVFDLGAQLCDREIAESEGIGPRVLCRGSASGAIRRTEPAITEPVFGRMKTKPQKKGAKEPAASRKTFGRRTEQPGRAGLANEARPGLGTRRDAPFPGEPGVNKSPRSKRSRRAANQSIADRQHSGHEPNDQPLPRTPREQAPDTWAHEEERSTGVSGHMGG